ncbi:hypothetical protein GIB67_029414 [Kingdonia uniflora]|uniref:Uncharacterized protein n=1 Tax=Kingdonia uniflora TaxID=39325 RepID=A0A7J7NXR7_9MAGN|nr:hypothetical protein GIB67_029414 [Kingdonia uniflora]
MVTTRSQSRESRIHKKMEELHFRYFGYQPLHLPTPIPVSPTNHRISYEEVMEAERRYRLLLLAEEAVITKDEAAGMAELERELKYCSMAAIDQKQLDADYYEHTFTLSMLLKRALKFEDQSARVKELESKLKMEKEQRGEEAKAAEEPTIKYSELVAHDDVMMKLVEALKVEQNLFIQYYYDFGLGPDDVELGRARRYKEIEFPSEALEEVMADAGVSPEKVELVVVQSQCIALRAHNKELNVEISSSLAALKSVTKLVEGSKVEMVKGRDVGARLSEDLQNEKVDLANELRKIEELREIIRKQEDEFTEYLDENTKLRDTNTKLDADLLQAEIRLDERRLEWESHGEKLDGSMSLIYHMDDFKIVLESWNSTVLDEKRRVEKQCEHLKTSL